MEHKRHIVKTILVACLLLAATAAGHVAAQVTYGPSDPSIPDSCGNYQWPPVMSPCPEVQIKQKHDHTPLRQYSANGWDTVVTCAQRTLELSCMPFLPVQYFNGQYTVDTIPYDPADPTYSRGQKMPVTTDDDFAAAPTQIPFSFFFFGLQKNAFVLGANGLITFDTNAAGNYCPYGFSAPIPWPDNTTGAPQSVSCPLSYMRDAIYGIYEDTHPIASYLHGDQGIYYGVQDEEPCRKIICSWNGIPTFPGSRNQNNRCTYQIVCYEGSNIIEVHVKRRGVNTQWQNGNGLLGIQNATGLPQVKGSTGETNMKVTNGAPAAFYPVGGNLLNTTLDSIGFRFTPKGQTNTSYLWYRLFDNGDTVHLSTDIYDTNGYYIPMGQTLSTCPSLTRAVVTPTCVSRYVFHLRFKDASNHWYLLYDTITIGVDTANDLTFRPSNGTAADHQMDICAGDNAKLTIEFPELQDTSHVTYHINRINGGVNVPLPDSLLEFGQQYVYDQTRTKRIPAILRPDPTAATTQPGEIDSINIQIIVDYVSGCTQTANLLVRAFPSYDTTEVYGICRGETFHWDVDGRDYTTATTAPQVNIPTAVGCDSVVHLDLTVSDISYTIDYVNVCKPYVWQNGRTYTETNTATAAIDTVHLLNVWGCDSTVQLDFTMHPMTPIIDADREFLDFNNLRVILSDVSSGGNGRTWYFPTGDPRTEAVVEYFAPNDVDSVSFIMVETSPYGCIDTAYLTIPFHRNLIWAPNAFTPEDEGDGNHLFHSVSRHLLKQQTLIYNRRGELLFDCVGIDCPWNGTDLNGNKCPQGSYVYIIRYTTEYEPHITQVLKGTVTLIR